MVDCEPLGIIGVISNHDFSWISTILTLVIVWSGHMLCFLEHIPSSLTGIYGRNFLTCHEEPTWGKFLKNACSASLGGIVVLYNLNTWWNKWERVTIRAKQSKRIHGHLIMARGPLVAHLLTFWTSRAQPNTLPTYDGIWFEIQCASPTRIPKRELVGPLVASGPPSWYNTAALVCRKHGAFSLYCSLLMRSILPSLQ